MTKSDINERLYAALENQCGLEVVMLALDSGADPNYSKHGGSLLAVAGATGRADAAKQLIMAGATMSGKEVACPLRYATDTSFSAKSELYYLRDIYCYRDGKPVSSLSVLSVSILCRMLPDGQKRHTASTLVKRLEGLISLGADPLMKDRQGLLPFDYAVLYGEIEEINSLICAGNAVRGEIDQQDEDGRTPLIRAVIENDLAGVKTRVAQGAATDIRDKQLHSALSLAIKHGHDDIAKFLVMNSAETSRRATVKSRASLLSALRLGNLGNLWLALKEGFPAPGIEMAFAYNHPRFIPLLLKYNPDVVGLEKRIPYGEATGFGASHINWSRKLFLRELLPSFMAQSGNIDSGEDWKIQMQSVEKATHLIKAIKNKYPDNPWMKWHDLAYEGLDYTGPAWRMRRLNVPTRMADRRMSMLEGPFFTSDEYPWPQASSGKYAAPIVQIDLKAVSELRGMPFGDGVLQIWNSDSEKPVIRTIPRGIVKTAEMTPIPSGSAKDYVDWPCDVDKWFYDGYVQHILGFEGPFVSYGYTESNVVPEDAPAELVQLIDLLNEIHKNNSASEYRADPQLFGTFDTLQYSPSEVGLPVLISLVFVMGTSHVFYRMTDAGLVFSFKWSC